MLAISLVFGSFLTVLFLIVGLVAGWMAREYMMTHHEGPKQIAYHPEFYDKDGDLIDEEIVSVRFEPGYFDDDECLYFVGVCYLNINPPQSTGTIIQDLDGHRHIIENKFNRFLIYSNRLFHSCQGSFGKNKNDARMVLTHATKFELKK